MTVAPADGGQPLAHLAERVGILGLVLALVATLAVALACLGQLSARLTTDGPHVVGEDAFTYLAAGERLVAGHPLYRLGPGDRPVAIDPVYWTSPLLSPPPIAVVWAPLSLFGESAAWSWLFLAAMAVVGTSALVIWHSPVIGSLLVIVSALGIAEQVAVGNVAALFAPAVFLIWIYRDHPAVGLLAGLMAAFKIAPIVLAAWLIGTRRWRALGWMLVTVLTVYAISLVVAGPESFVDYVGVARSTNPSFLSLSSLMGIAAMSYLALCGFAAISLLSGRRDGGSFVVAVMAFTLFTPAFYLAAMVTIPPLAIVASRNRHGSAPPLSAALA